MAYIEPCCIDHQLPPLLKSGGMTFFQTNGDVTLGKMMNAVSALAGDGHVLLIAVAEVDLLMLRAVDNYFRRGWTLGLMLVTQTNQQALVSSELGEWLGRVQYAADPMVLDGLTVFVGSRQAVVIQGAVLSEPDFSLCQYAGWCGSSGETLAQAIDPLVAKLKTKPLLRASDSCEAVAAVLARRYFE